MLIWFTALNLLCGEEVRSEPLDGEVPVLLYNFLAIWIVVPNNRSDEMNGFNLRHEPFAFKRCSVLPMTSLELIPERRDQPMSLLMVCKCSWKKLHLSNGCLTTRKLLYFSEEDISLSLDMARIGATTLAWSLGCLKANETKRIFLSI